MLQHKHPIEDMMYIITYEEQRKKLRINAKKLSLGSIFQRKNCIFCHVFKGA